MKNLSIKLAIVVVLAISFTLLTGCPSPNADSVKDTTDKKTEKKKSESKDYPPAPEAIAKAEFELINGEKFKLEDNKGKVVLFNLWAIWCGPCIKEMPHLNELHETYKDDGLIIVGVNTGNDVGDRESKENIEKFIAKQNLQYTIAQTERPAIEAFFRLGQMGGVIPQSFLINRNGELTGIFQGGSPKVILQMKEVVGKVVKDEELGDSDKSKENENSSTDKEKDAVDKMPESEDSGIENNKESK